TCSLVECVEDETSCDKVAICGAHEVWKTASMIMKNYFESISLADVIEIADKKIAAAKKKAKSK
ncbi:MAG: hypothetical protein ACYDH3_07695, partial [Candidatus Aminicenantales bacterium]